MENGKYTVETNKIGWGRRLMFLAALAAAAASILAAGTFALLHEKTPQVVNSFTGVEAPKEVTLKAGYPFVQLISSGYNSGNYTQDSVTKKIIFGDKKNHPEYKAAVEGITGVCVDEHGEDLCLAYKVNDDDGNVTVYILTEEPAKVYANSNCMHMFHGFKGLTSITWGENFDTSRVTNMSWMFGDCGNVSGLADLDLSGFDLSRVIDMSCMFSSSGITNLKMNDRKMENVTNMNSMFSSCKKLETLDLGGCDARGAEDMQNMFSGCNNLTSLNLKGFRTENVTNMGNMFTDCSSLKNLDVSGFSTGKAKNMVKMFYNCKSLTNLDLSSFDTAEVTDMSSMFCECNKLESLDLSSFYTGKVTNMKEMFYRCEALESLDLSGFNISSVEERDYAGFYNMFYKCSNLSAIYVTSEYGDWVTHTKYKRPGTNIGMFTWCGKLKGGKGTTTNGENSSSLLAARIDDPENGNPGLFTCIDETEMITLDELEQSVSGNDLSVSGNDLFVSGDEPSVSDTDLPEWEADATVSGNDLSISFQKTENTIEDEPGEDVTETEDADAA